MEGRRRGRGRGRRAAAGEPGVRCAGNLRRTAILTKEFLLNPRDFDPGWSWYRGAGRGMPRAIVVWLGSSPCEDGG